MLRHDELGGWSLLLSLCALLTSDLCIAEPQACGVGLGLCRSDTPLLWPLGSPLTSWLVAQQTSYTTARRRPPQELIDTAEKRQMDQRWMQLGSAFSFCFLFFVFVCSCLMAQWAGSQCVRCMERSPTTGPRRCLHCSTCARSGSQVRSCMSLVSSSRLRTHCVFRPCAGPDLTVVQMLWRCQSCAIDSVCQVLHLFARFALSC